MSTPTKKPRTRSPFGAHTRRRTLIGIFVVIVFAIITYAIFVKRLPGTERWTVSAVFADTTQVRTGSPVRIAGVDVGQVVGVRRGPGTTAELSLEIKREGRPLHTDAKASIRPRLFLEGSYYVDLQPGSPSAPQLGRGGTIPLPQTSLPVQFSPVLSTLTTPVRESLTGIIKEGADALDKGGARGLKKSIKALGPAFRESAITTQAAMGTEPDDVSRLIAGANRVTAVLALNAPQLAAGLTDFNRVATALAETDGDLTRTIVGTDKTLREAPPALRAVRASLPDVRRFAREVDPSLRRAPGVLKRTVPLLDQVRGLVSSGELPRLLTIVPKLTTQLNALLPKLRELLPRTQDVAECMGNQGMGLLEAKLDDGALSTGQPAWQEFAHAYVNGSSIGQSFDANGNYVRASLDTNLNALALGSVPGVGVLLGDAQKPITGTRPIWNGPTQPVLRPDVPCSQSPLPSFASDVGPSPVTKTTLTSIDKLPSMGALADLVKTIARKVGSK